MLTYLQRKLSFGALIALSTAILVNAAFYAGFFDEFELKVLDFRSRTFNIDKRPPSDIAVILIDEASLRTMNPVVGRWPWPRSLHADLIEFLALSGARAVIFDILFTENERIPGEPPGTAGVNDVRLVEATEASGNIYHSVQLLKDIEDEYNKDLLRKPLPRDFIERFSVKGTEGIVAGDNNIYYIPFPQLYRASKGIGVVEFSPDHDGIYRRTRLFRHYQGAFFPVLSMAPLLDILKPESIKVEGDNLILSSSSQLPADGPSRILIPLRDRDSYLINMYGDFAPYSMSGVLASLQKIKMGELEGLPVSPDEFKDKVVFIGASAVGVEDLKPTSIGARTPGVYLHVSVYGNIVHNDFLTYAGNVSTSLSIVLLSFGMTFLILWIRSIFYQIGIPFLISLAYISISFWWFRSNIVFDIVAPVVSVVFSWIGTFAYISITEGKDKRKIKKMLTQYVSPTILSAVVDKSPQSVLKAEVGTRENLTILFADIRGFTSISETHEAEKVVEVLNGYLSGMVDVIFKHAGTLDKFIGDAIMAFWGAPIKADDHAKKAVETAVEMITWLKTFNQEIESKELIPLRIGIGINTGEVILGNIGSEKKLDYTIIGDNVNLASRMEGLTKEYSCSILITETTYKDIKDTIPCRTVDMVRVKGKKKGIKIFEPMVLPQEQSGLCHKIVSLSEQGFAYYLNREWQKAMETYSALLSLKPDDILSRIFMKRCKDYMEEEPPKDWDGIYTMLKK